MYVIVCITYMLLTSNLYLTYKQLKSAYTEDFYACTKFWTSSPFNNIYHRTVASLLCVLNLSLTYSAYTDTLAEFLIRPHILVLYIH